MKMNKGIIEVRFHDFVGEAGDEHALRIGVASDGRRETELYNRASVFADFYRRRAEKRIIKKLKMTEGVFKQPYIRRTFH
jgi:hypothetical protein